MVLPPPPHLRVADGGEACSAQDATCKYTLNPDVGTCFADSPVAGAGWPVDGTVAADGRVWRQVDGPFMAVNLAVVSLRNGKSPRGLCPASHLSSGHGDLVVVHRCGRLAFLRFLLGVAGGGTHLRQPAVAHIPCSEFLFAPHTYVRARAAAHPLQSTPARP